MSFTPTRMDVDGMIRSAEFFRDPYEMYRTLRSAGPAVVDESTGSVGLFAYEDVSAALRDSRLIAARSDNFFSWLELDQQDVFAPLARSQRNMMLFADPPEHTRLRGLVNKAFTPRVAASLRPRIQSIVDDLLATLDGATEFDVIESIAYPLPVLVILELLGVTAEDRVRLKTLSDSYAAFLGGNAREPGVAEAANAAIMELNDYYRDAIARRRREPGNDLISGLIAAEEKGTVLTEDEMLATCILLLVAGHETTTNLIGNGLLALLRNPTARAAFLLENVSPRTAIDELLRYDSPVQLTGRLTSEPVVYGGVEIDAGTVVNIWLGSANRDPGRFVDPDVLDLARHDNRHMAFGYGIHFCVGAPLARLEGEIALRSVLRRFPDLRLGDEPLAYHGSLVFRALTQLQVNR